MKKIAYIFSLILLSFTFLKSAKAQDISGREFWFSPPSESAILNLTNQGEQFQFLYLVSNYDDTITMEYVALKDNSDPECVKRVLRIRGGVPLTEYVPYLGSTCEFHSDTLSNTEVKQYNGIKISSKKYPFAVYYYHYEAASSEVTPILPIDMMGTDYWTIGMRENDNGGTASFIARVTTTAIEDNTVINFELPDDTWTTRSGVPTVKRAPKAKWNITLNKGQTYTFVNTPGLDPSKKPTGSSVTSGNNLGLNGIHITSTKKISVIAGATCTRMGEYEYGGCSACDIVFTHLKPVNKWEKKFVSTQTLNRAVNAIAPNGPGATPKHYEPFPASNINNASISDYLYFIASEDNTKINVTGIANYSVTLNKGDYRIYESPRTSVTQFGRADHVITADKPIQVAQLMKGFYCDNQDGDPTQMLVFDEKSWTNNYILTNPSQYVRNYLVFVTKDVGGTSTSRSSLSVSQGGANIPVAQTPSPTGDGLNGWTEIGTTKYFVQRLVVSPGVVLKMKCDSNFAFYCSGSGGPGSYGYMGGNVCKLKIKGAADEACPGRPTTFRLDSLDGGSITPTLAQPLPASYTWTPDITVPGTTVIGANATYTYTGLGPYKASLRLVDIAGCVAIDTFDVKIRAALTPPTVSGPLTACTGSTVILTASSSEPGVDFYWYSTPTGNIPPALASDTPKYSPGVTTGSVTVYCEARTSGCISTRTPFTVVFGTTLSPPIVRGDTTVCKGNNTTLTADAGSVGQSYRWYDAPTGGKLLSSTDIYVYKNVQQDSTFYVEAGTAPCTSTRRKVTVHMVPLPVANFSLSSPTICVGSQVDITFTGTTPAKSKYTWNFDGGDVVSGTAGSAGPYTINYPTEGTKNITLMVVDTEGCTSTTVTKALVVSALPTSDFEVDLEAGCKGDVFTLLYKGNASANATYNWDFGADASIANPTTQGPHSVSWSSGGTKDIKLTVTENNCTSTETVNQVFIVDIKVDTFTFNSTSCTTPNGKIALRNIRGHSGSYVITWAGGESTDSLEDLSQGNYTVMIEDVEYGCGLTYNFTINNPNSALKVDAGDTVNICNPQQITLSALVTGQVGTPTYKWTLPPSNTVLSTSADYTFTPQQSGQYQIEVTDASSCTATAFVMVNINSKPVIDSVSGNKTICSGNSTTLTANTAATGTNYRWFDVSGQMVSTSQSFTTPALTTNTNYKVVFENSSSCVSDTFAVNIVVNPAVNSPATPLPTCGTSTNTSVTFVWNDDANTVTFDVSVNGAAFTTPTSRTLHSISGLSPGQSASIQVRANGASNASCPQNNSTSQVVNCVATPDSSSIKFPELTNIDPADPTAGFRPYYSGNVSNYRLQIFSRWGEVLFTTDDINAFWFGKKNNLGDVLPDGVYIYVATAKDITNKTNNYTGTVSIKRKGTQ